MVKAFLSLIEKNELKGHTWIDLETVIYQQIINVKGLPKGYFNSYPVTTHSNHNARSINDYFNSIEGTPYSIIKNGQKEYIKTDTEKVELIYSQLREFTQKFEIYLLEEINTKLSGITNPKYKLQLSTVPQNEPIKLKVINFNYTDTLSKLYDRQFNPESFYEIESVYIHGKTCNNSNDCDLVLGAKSFDKEDLKTTKLIPYINIFQKHNQRHKYGVIEAYQDFLREINDNRKIINPVFHVIGHSLDETDHNILKHIFNAKKDSIINIYYHNEVTQDKLIKNITEILTEEEVMKRVRLIHQHDDKRSILIPCE